MKAIVLAGGHATRLWPLTKDRAKPLLPLGDQPIIGYVLDELTGIDAVDDIIISTNARFADDFESFLDDAGYGSARVLVEDHTEEAEKIGSLGAIIQTIRQAGEDDYVVVGGDNYTTFALADFVEYAREQDAIVNACYELEQAADASDFGVVTTDADAHVTGFEEKPATPSSRLVSTAFYYFPASMLDVFDAYTDAFEGTDTDYLDEPGRLIEWGHERYGMYAYTFTGGWFDIGTPQNYLRAQAAVADRRTSGEITDSDLGDNVWIMEDAEIADSELSNCIIFPGAEIEGSSLQNCIVDEEAVVKAADLDGAVIGAYSKVQ